MGKIVVLHPDLGIGGAERLVVDVALALQKEGHDVQFVTAHHDSNHCFAETKDGSFRVTVVGDWLPRSIYGRFHAVFAYLRMMYAAMYLVFFSGIKPDLVFCDQVSACIPILRYRGLKVVFYCHFPDQLLSYRDSRLKQMYRAPLDWLEEVTTGMADKVLVNSKFTASVFKATFKRLAKVTPDVLYPSVNTDLFEGSATRRLNEVIEDPAFLVDNAFLFLSINRYERKKNLSLVLRAFADLRTILDEDKWSNVFLIMAGGYDNRVKENVEHFTELVCLAVRLGVSEKVKFFKSPSDSVKLSLLYHSHCLVYTPANEHFGIVPLEAMHAKKPVIAVNSGGPTETVVDGVTGFLCEPEPDKFAEAMSKFVSNKPLVKRMGLQGRDWVMEKFSFLSFSKQLQKIVMEFLKSDDSND
ncbi:alpha-1,3/1,6-mannosyltransferase ALG2 [Schistocerca americana]|uniref:alpha-1,3/1,6-mannosyltransferase ALG2 n=1 Tax=Schistocerca americana TaxID=7009 RepID=UPI001F4FCD1D|nr:alpha-1,3/1,6-mannosyltransferase ALG2 [Schistocerca americana]